MKKINTSPVSGMQELLPGRQAIFDKYKTGITETFLSHGFLKIETPAIDRTEILLAKAGGDTEKQIYKVVKTAEAADDADQALRFDHTVPLARYTVEHLNDLPFPFKATQVARNFRGERPQKGRFREFYQCDIDVIGWQTLPLVYDAEVMATLMEALGMLPLGQVKLRVSNRKLLTGLIEELGLEKDSAEIFSIIDHAEKVPPEKTIAALESVANDKERAAKLLEFASIHGTRGDVIKKLGELKVENATFREGIEELDTVLEFTEIKLKGVRINSMRSIQSRQASFVDSEQVNPIVLEADMLIVRGLDYYTGTVFETVATSYPEFGSICSGGRYANLASNYTDQQLQGVGGSIGLTRLFAAFLDSESISLDEEKPVDICLIPVSENDMEAAEDFARAMREENKKVDVLLSSKKLGDKFNYASKVARYAAVIGEDEASSRQCTLKNLETRETEVYKLA